MAPDPALPLLFFVTMFLRGRYRADEESIRFSSEVHAEVSGAIAIIHGDRQIILRRSCRHNLG